MSEQQRESTGRTVDEAIREALLRMGLRREEVDVTVVQEARSGILGLGRRPAVVRVVKKSGQAKDVRGRRQDGADGGSSGRGRRGERLDGADGRRDGRRGERGRTARAEKDGGDGRRGRDRGKTGRRPAAEVDKIRVAAEAADTPDPARRQGAGADRPDEQRGDEARRRRRRRPRRRKPGADQAGEAPAAVTSASGPEEAVGSRNGARPVRDDRVAAAPAAPAAPTAPAAPDVTSDPAPTADLGRARDPEPAPSAARSEEPAPQAGEPEHQTGEGGTPMERDQSALVLDIAADSRCTPWTAADAAAQPAFLERVATELMVKSGFPCRVQVQEGDYHQVKMVVDDRSAGILIGRYGNTVDAVEHLVEKIASKAAGERVRMNLDINNYRLRCEDQLLQRARAAANEARETGQPVALEPAGGRERRIVHLYIQETDDLATYTEDGQDGKHVVVCRPDQVPEHARQRDQAEQAEGDDAPDPAGDGLEMSVGAVIDVRPAERRDETPRSDRPD